jgi:hypothetical protein
MILSPPQISAVEKMRFGTVCTPHPVIAQYSLSRISTGIKS